MVQTTSTVHITERGRHVDKTMTLTLEDLDNHVENLYEVMSLDDWMSPAKEVHDRMDRMTQRFVKTFGEQRK